MVLGVVRPEMAMDFGSKKWNRCMMRGISLESPWTNMGLLKTVPICLLDKKVHVNLLELNGLKCVWKMIC